VEVNIDEPVEEVQAEGAVYAGFGDGASSSEVEISYRLPLDLRVPEPIDVASKLIGKAEANQ
jgi:hypothetical protein